MQVKPRDECEIVQLYRCEDAVEPHSECTYTVALAPLVRTADSFGTDRLKVTDRCSLIRASGQWEWLQFSRDRVHVRLGLDLRMRTRWKS